MTELAKFNEGNLLKRLRDLPDDRISAFGVLSAERLTNSVRVFFKSVPVISTLTKANDAVWDWVLYSRKSDISEFESSLLSQMPDEDEAPSFEDSILDDACAAAIYALRSTHGDHAQNSVWATRRAYETADRYAAKLIDSLVFDAETERKIISDPVVQQELHRQIRDLEELFSSIGADASLLGIYRGEHKDEAVISL